MAAVPPAQGGRKIQGTSLRQSTCSMPCRFCRDSCGTGPFHEHVVSQCLLVGVVVLRSTGRLDPLGYDVREHFRFQRNAYLTVYTCSLISLRAFVGLSHIFQVKVCSDLVVDSLLARHGRLCAALDCVFNVPNNLGNPLSMPPSSTEAFGTISHFTT